ncbi:MAG: hypothetical protein ABW097_06440 [Candidatus Thiodiazotropha lotti]
MDNTNDMNSVDDLSDSDEYSPDGSSIKQNDYAIFWYCANTRYGIVNIGLFKDSAINAASLNYKNTVLEQIKTLAREETNIRLLEDWMEEGLDLRPDSTVERFEYSLKLSDRNNATNSVNNSLAFSVTKETIKKLPIPNWILDNRLYVESSCISSYITLSSNTIDKKYVDQFKKDNVLLIPESFSNEWLVYAKSLELGSNNIILKIDDNLQSFYINSELKQTYIVDRGADNQNNNFLQIVIDQEIEIPFHLLLGWTDKSNYILKKRLNSHSVKIISNSVCIALGRLIPIASGHGIYIDKIY